MSIFYIFECLYGYLRGLIRSMTTDFHHYNLFLKFLETYTPSGFDGIGPNDPVLEELERIMELNNQFIYVADAIQMKIHFTSKRSKEILGIPPDELSFYHFMEATHPSDIQRLNLGRSKVVKLAQDLFIAEKGYTLVSTNYKYRIPSGEYSDFLVQCYLYYTTIPYKTVFFLKIHTNIDWHKKIKYGYHYYVGNDFSYFKYPDEELLQKGNIFSLREFEIIRLIGSGLSSDEIAEKLFLSVHTVNTHRRNILEKSGKENISELIYELIERGVL
jgi:DNA-binding CsgD family transcriptional regulator